MICGHYAEKYKCRNAKIVNNCAESTHETESLHRFSTDYPLFLSTCSMQYRHLDTKYAARYTNNARKKKANWGKTKHVYRNRKARRQERNV